ncbi:MAG: cation:proton antiporter [Cyanophyceae cyanobacterium]
MATSVDAELLLVLLVGITIIFALLIKAGLERVGVPALVGYLLFGFGMRLADGEGWFLSSPVLEVYRFLAELGIIALLFRVGLESNLAGLLRQLPRASVILLGDVLGSGLLGFGAAYWLLNLNLITSLLIAIALVATSVGISVSVWQEEKALHSPNGELLLDIAEMDDIAAIALMSLLFAIIPSLGSQAFLPVLAEVVGPFLLKVLLFGTLCFVFFRYLERPMTRFFERIEPPPDPMLMVAGTGIVIAALAGFLGFSVAVGAFFAGLAFSRDPEAVKLDASFGTLYDFLVPFFFIHVGLQIDPLLLGTAWGLGSILLAIAIAGKIIGIGSLALVTAGYSSAVLLSVSMLPRAEITLVILQRGQQLGWAVPPSVFAALVLVSAATCLLSPLLLRPLLQRWHQLPETIP